ncbi:MAG: DNA primase noncatalytic subunit PriX [Nitrosopumilus sp.]|nr:DNA primase noncatalytic subunit PriX [Nitrosopumilus sp.]
MNNFNNSSNIEFGLDYILRHFDSSFPRKISTMLTENKQVQVYSKGEALDYFIKSNFIDCRISAFGLTEIEHEKPNLIFVDLDDKSALNETLALFHKEIDGIPLVLNTDNGYAIIQPIQIISLSNVTLKQKRIFDVSKKFLQFAERYLSNHKCDTGNHPSLKSCMIRVPYSYNKKSLLQGKSKDESKVSIHSEWDGIRPNVNNLPFLRHLNKLDRLYKKRSNNFSSKDEIVYIEKILKVKITDGKKRIFALILCPYLVNVKKLTLEESEKIILDYFENSIPRQSINYKLKEVYKKGILPYSLEKMKTNDSELYSIILDSGVLEK